MSDIAEKLKQVKVSQLLESKKPPRQVISLNANDTLEHAIEILSKNQIQAAPVKDDNGKYMGFLDQLDIVTYVLRMYTDSGDTYQDIRWSQYCNDVKKLEHRGVHFGKTPVKLVLGSWSPSKDNFIEVKNSTNVWDLVKIFARGIHRAPVFDDDTNTLVGIVTQSDVINYVAMNPVFGSIGNQTVGELNLGSKGVVSMSMNALAVHAFFLMYYNRVTSIAVIDDNDKLIANVAANDIKRIRSSNLADLLQPLSQFCRTHPTSILPPSVCTPQSPLNTIILQLSLFRIHRVFIVNNEFKPIGVISTSDIMKLLTEV